MSKKKKYGIGALILVLVLGIYYYVTLPAINIQRRPETAGVNVDGG